MLSRDLKVISVWFQNKRRPSKKILVAAQCKTPYTPDKLSGECISKPNVKQIANITTAPANRPIFAPNNISGSARTGLDPIWTTFPSSPRETESDSSFVEISAHEQLHLDETFTHKTLEWACQKESAQRAFLRRKFTTSPSNMAEKENSILNIRSGMLLSFQPQMSTRLYDKDEFEVAFALLQMRDGDY